MSKTLLVDRRDHVLLLTLNRPRVRNAVDLELTIAMGEALEQAERDRNVWAVVVTGAGTEAFCAGADLKALARGEPVLPEDRRNSWGFAGYTNHPISKPTIAAVNGFALGGGTELALASDLIVAAETASFGLPEVSRGIIAAAGGAFRLPDQLPKKIAIEMILTGTPIDARRALELGFVNVVVPLNEVVHAALELAERICKNAPLAVQASKRAAYGIVGDRIPAEDDAWRRSQIENEAVFKTSDAHEGAQAFADKRQPTWRNE